MRLKTMNLSDFELERVCALIRAYGVKSDRWPKDDQYLAPALDDERFSILLEDERLLDDLIEFSDDVAPSQDLFNATLAIPNGSKSRVSTPYTFGLWPFRALWQPASVASLALVAGIAVGQLTQVQVTADSVATNDEMYGLDEEITVAMGDLAFGELYIVTEVLQ